MRFEEACSDGKCDVCGAETKIVVCASSMGPISYAYCQSCLEKGLEPYGGMVVYISCAGHFPDDINEAYQDSVRRTLKETGVSEEKFIGDVDEAIKKMDDYFASCEPVD